MKNDALLQELKFRAMTALRRGLLGATNPALAEQARRDEQQLMDDTEALDEHPDDYDGPCYCAECRSYLADS